MVEPGLSIVDLFSTLRARIRLLVACPLAVGIIAYGASYLITPTFTATTTFMPPQQAQSSTAAALASLGALGALGGIAGVGGAPSPAERYIALMQSVTVSDRVTEQFKLLEVYGVRYRVEVRDLLAKYVRMSAGKKDGMISIEVDDESPQRAAAMANNYVAELRQVVGKLAVTEAQQRRAFFEDLLNKTKTTLGDAQAALQRSGFNPGALKAEPKAAAEAYAKLKTESTTAEVRLQALRGNLSDNTPEVRQQLAAIGALREQMARTAQTSVGNESAADYIGRFRDFKYQETLFELYARQFELARVDESREGGLIQIVDVATPPEKKSKPRRGLIAAMSAIFAGFAAVMWVLVRQRMSMRRPPELASPA